MIRLSNIRRFTYLVLIALVLFGCNAEKNRKPTVGLQPLGKVQQHLLDSVVVELEKSGVFSCHILPMVEMPSETFVHIKSPRYRADKLLKYLKRTKPDSIDYVMGLTAFDISTTKKDNFGNTLEPKSKYEDWGVFGLGYKPGVASIVSVYRLNSKPAFLTERLQKVCLHELGHNLGLAHCESKSNCVMSDAAESISTIDNESKNYCSSCSEELSN